MEYQVFLEKLRDLLEKRLEDGMKLRIETVNKYNNVVKDSLSIFKEGDNISPVIYLDDYYQKYLEGMTIDTIAFQILSLYRKRALKDKLDISAFMNWNTACGRIIPRLINTLKNEKLLQTIPSKPFLNLSVIYVYLMDNFVEGRATITITNEQMNMWNVSREDLDKAAFENMDSLAPFEFGSMRDLLKEMTGLDEGEILPMDEVLHVVSNKFKEYGAVWICRDDKLKQIWESIGRDYLVIPSSVHECIIIPDDNEISCQEMVSFVSEVNLTSVAPEEVLADCVYGYSKKDGRLSIRRQ